MTALHAAGVEVLVQVRPLWWKKGWAWVNEHSLRVAAPAAASARTLQLQLFLSTPPPQFDLTFTAEGTDATPSTLSLRGLDYAAYYRRNGVLNCGHPAARAYVLRALHHWAREGADGFVFINAENMAQGEGGCQRRPCKWQAGVTLALQLGAVAGPRSHSAPPTSPTALPTVLTPRPRGPRAGRAAAGRGHLS